MKLSLLFEFASGYTGLSNSRLESSDAKFRVERDRHGYSRVGKLFLHDEVATTLPNLYESMTR